MENSAEIERQQRTVSGSMPCRKESLRRRLGKEEE